MLKLLAAATLILTLSDTGYAQDTPILDGTTLGLFADGTWDCKDSAGTYLGAVVVADLSYAFINTDGSIGKYGKLDKDDWVDAPGFIVLSGEVKDRFGGIGMYVKGPMANPEAYTDRSKLRLQIVITADTKLQCARRQGPAT